MCRLQHLATHTHKPPVRWRPSRTCRLWRIKCLRFACWRYRSGDSAVERGQFVLHATSRCARSPAPSLTLISYPGDLPCRCCRRHVITFARTSGTACIAGRGCCIVSSAPRLPAATTICVKEPLAENCSGEPVCVANERRQPPKPNEFSCQGNSSPATQGCPIDIYVIHTLSKIVDMFRSP